MDEIAAIRAALEAHDEHRISDATFRAQIEGRVDAVEASLLAAREAARAWRSRAVGAGLSAMVGLLVAVASFALGKL